MTSQTNNPTLMGWLANIPLGANLQELLGMVQRNLEGFETLTLPELEALHQQAHGTALPTQHISPATINRPPKQGRKAMQLKSKPRTLEAEVLYHMPNNPAAFPTASRQVAADIRAHSPRYCLLSAHRVEEIWTQAWMKKKSA